MIQDMSDLLRDRGGFGDTYTHIPLESTEDTDSDGRADLVFGDPREIEASLRARPPELASGLFGEVENARFAAYVPDDQGVSDGDSLLADVAGAEERFEFTEPQAAPKAGFTVWILKEDERVANA